MQRIPPEGSKVFITHYRYTTEDNGMTLPAKFIREKGLPFVAKGGSTKAVVKLEDGREVTAFSVCSRVDSFNKRIGRTIAIGRALKSLEM